MNKCIDCKKEIGKKSKRCQLCHLKILNDKQHIEYLKKHSCIDCGIELKNFYAKRCKKCYGKYISKNNKNEYAPNWRGGRSFLTVLPEYIRLNIFKRDNYTCQICNKKGGRLDVHHKIPRELFKLEYIGEAHKEFNLITLCRACHNLVHDKYNWR